MPITVQRAKGSESGADASGGLAFSIRVDGVFTDKFRSGISYPEQNRSAAPASWAAAG